VANTSVPIAAIERLTQRVNVRTGDQEMESVTLQEAIIMKQIEKAISGDTTAAKFVIDLINTHVPSASVDPILQTALRRFGSPRTS